MGYLYYHHRLCNWVAVSGTLSLCLRDFQYKGTIDQRAPRPEWVIEAQGLVLG